MALKPTISQLIADATAAGRSMLTAANAAAQKTLLSLVKGDVGLGNVDNTSDANKPVSTAQQTAIDAKIGGTVGTTANRLPRSSGTGGLTLQASGITVDSSDNVSGVGTFSSGAITSSGNVTLSGRVVKSGALPDIDLQVGSAGAVRFLTNTGTLGPFFVPNTNAATISGIVDVGTLNATALIRLGTYTVATLPSASANPGRIAQVTDSSVTANGSAVAGGGSNRVMVFSNGTNWDVVVA